MILQQFRFLGSPCRKCGTILTAENMRKGNPVCKPCHNNYEINYRKNHPELIISKREYTRGYSRNHVMIVNGKYVRANKPPNPEDNVCPICGKKEKVTRNGKLFALACHHWSNPKVSFRCCQECNMITLKAIDLYGIDGLIKINEKYQSLKTKLEKAE